MLFEKGLTGKSKTGILHSNHTFPGVADTKLAVFR
jgi:hypothetical protein